MAQPIDHYIPGVCNIGPAEIKMRKRLGWYGLLLTVAVGIFLFWIDASAPWRLIVIIPAFFSANGFFQGYMHFCAGFGMRGLFNFRDKIGETDTVQQAEFRAQDRKKAQQIFLYSTLAALAVALIAFLI